MKRSKCRHCGGDTADLGVFCAQCLPRGWRNRCRVEITVDEGIRAACPPEVWDRVYQEGGVSDTRLCSFAVGTDAFGRCKFRAGHGCTCEGAIKDLLYVMVERWRRK